MHDFIFQAKAEAALELTKLILTQKTLEAKPRDPESLGKAVAALYNVIFEEILPDRE